jgi:integrase
MLKPSTRWSSERLIKGKIRPRFGKTKLKELTRADISSWHRSMSNTPVEANRALACFRKLLSLASGDWELLEQNPARGISPFPEQKRERVPTDEELRKLGSWLALVEADGSELPGCVLAAKLMFFTAMRRGEVLGLEWSFIDLENGSARLPDAKSGRRTVPLGITTVDLLKNVSRTGKYVCCGFTANEMLSEATFRGFWDRMRAATGIEGLSAHDLRRGALTRAAIMGLSAFAIRDLAGHRSLAMANRYVQRAGNALRPIADDVSERMAAALNPAPQS